MSKFHTLAQELNSILEREAPQVLRLLSERGWGIYFPKTGIIGQTMEAEDAKLNATIGIALEEDSSPMRLPTMDRLLGVGRKGGLSPEEVYPYANTYGVPALRERWLKEIRKKNPSLRGACSTPVVTSGLTQALSIAAYLFQDPDDTLLLPDFYWGNYRLIFENTYGVKLQTFSTFKGEGFDVESLRKALRNAPERAVLFLNFPNNPCGYTPTVEEAVEIVGVIRESAESGRSLVTIIDDAYFGLVYEKGVIEESLFTELSDLHENVVAVKIDGATKEDYVWGHRVGFITFAWKGITQDAASAIESKASGAVRGLTSNVSNLAQNALLHLYESPTYEREKQEKFETLRHRYRCVKEVLRDPKYAACFEALPYNSGYFLCLKAVPGVDAEIVRKLLLSDFSTGTVALGTTLFRVAYSSLPLADIPQFFENLYQACMRVKAITAPRSGATSVFVQ